MKKLILIVLSVLMLVTVAAPVGAATVDVDNTVQPRWTNTSVVNAYFACADGLGYVESSVTAKIGASSVQTDMYLYKLVDDDWEYVDELHVIQYQRNAATSLSFEANGEYFRADFTFTVTKSGVAEVIERTIEGNVSP